MKNKISLGVLDGFLNDDIEEKSQNTKNLENNNYNKQDSLYNIDMQYIFNEEIKQNVKIETNSVIEV